MSRGCCGLIGELPEINKYQLSVNMITISVCYKQSNQYYDSHTYKHDSHTYKHDSHTYKHAHIQQIYTYISYGIDN